ncbi:tetratricopeptide repeat protein [Polynucleobacter asymbioticus]|uniref:protein O-GlcNAc transferase n=1 Tax=Polynucleobacter asymbioticus (strain DSM 18221 / CIP 109841 / QLW-P1DMWA-1) TaxID=312153 RepID=A4SZX6_POLAQ|nr:tetratricopeptide repeat protein [Polynucleobacter asymbioticus]ABP35040.1 TPR repeat-containing protein [Polynucleobacter asymbioticus QLW-P1DMWA-1]
MNPQLQMMLQQALQSFQNGNYERADSILVKIIKADSKNLPALHVLGLIKASQKKYQEAADLLSKAARLNPNEASIQYNLAKSLADCGSFRESIPHHKKAVELMPNNPEALLNYAITLGALASYEEALNVLDKAILIQPNYAEAFLNHGLILAALNRLEDANISFDSAIRLNPSSSESCFNKGIVLTKLNKLDEALNAYISAIHLNPDYLDAWLNRGVVLHALKCYGEAIDAFNMVIKLNPNHFQAWFNKGASLKELQRYEEALIAYDNSINLNVEYSDAWVNKAAALHELKRFNESIEAYQHALKLNPKIDWVEGDLLHTKMKVCLWDDFDESLADLMSKVRTGEKSITPFPLLSLVDDGLLQKQCSTIYANSKFPLNAKLGPLNKLLQKERIRIGYFSADFRNHAVSALTAQLFELHNKQKFEIIAFSYGPDDQSLMRNRLSKAFDQFLDIGSQSDMQIAKLSRDLGIDIAIDLGGFTTDSRPGIFSYRAAPIQAGYIGYLGTMGANYMDYLFADKTIIPHEAEQYYSEKIVYLPSYQVNDTNRKISDEIFSRESLGLPKDEFVFACFNNNYKILPATFNSWMNILKATPKSVLYLYADNPWSKDNLMKEAEARGVKADRLIFGGRIDADQYLARYRACDLFLDTAPYNAGTTASDALWAGLPVLTLIGQSFPSRVASSLLNAVGLPELVTSSAAEYEIRAIELAMNPEMMSAIKLKLVNNQLTTLLFDTPRFTESIEAVYTKMYGDYQSNVGPNHISLG